jgi:hypothetical protein
LDEPQAQEFIRQLWSALPPHRLRSPRPGGPSGAAAVEPAAGARAAAPSPGRLVFSCRSHYFKTIRDQNAAFTGQDRDSVQAGDYRACVLLPFNEPQIREYLRQVFARGEPAMPSPLPLPKGDGTENAVVEKQIDDAWKLFAAVHDLTELSRRPYLLSLIADHLGELEARRADGLPVRGVTLYDLLVHRWLARDQGKHRLDPDDKQRLMEDLAAAMWRDGAREWTWAQVRDWFGGRLADDRVLATRYASQGHAVLEEDFRTATFVLRPDSSFDGFRFAHTSLHEYFLARYLLRALRRCSREECTLPLPSPETLDFLGQLLECAGPREREAALNGLNELLADRTPQAGEWAFRYWLQAIQRGLPEPQPDHVDLRDADLAGLSIRGRSPASPLRLAGICLAGARLTECPLRARRSVRRRSARGSGESGRVSERVGVGSAGGRRRSHRQHLARLGGPALARRPVGHLVRHALDPLRSGARRLAGRFSGRRHAQSRERNGRNGS